MNCLGHLLPQRVDLDDHGSDLRRVSAGIQQIAELLDQGLRGLNERHERRLPPHPPRAVFAGAQHRCALFLCRPAVLRSFRSFRVNAK